MHMCPNLVNYICGWLKSQVPLHLGLAFSSFTQRGWLTLRRWHTSSSHGSKHLTTSCDKSILVGFTYYSLRFSIEREELEVSAVKAFIWR